MIFDEQYYSTACRTTIIVGTPECLLSYRYIVLFDVESVYRLVYLSGLAGSTLVIAGHFSRLGALANCLYQIESDCLSRGSIIHHMIELLFLSICVCSIIHCVGKRTRCRAVSDQSRINYSAVDLAGWLTGAPPPRTP